ncbi:isocitrate lyase domain protein [Mycobacterium kansasii 824]|nr:isocitrate lyase domain protein [Mycobacterium kansasii 824]
MLELGIYGNDDEPLANVVFDPIKDRHGRSILTVRDQNTFAQKLRQKRLMTLIHLWLVHRFKATPSTTSRRPRTTSTRPQR